MSSNTLWELLLKQQENDEGIGLSDEDFKQLTGDIKDKVDLIKDFFTRCEYEVQRLDECYIKPIQKRKKTIENSMDKMKDYVIRTMKEHDFTMLNGELFTLRIQEKESVQIDDIEVTQSFYMDYKEITKRKYELSKKDIADQLKQGISYPFARFVKNSFIKFTVKSGEKKK